MGNGPMKTFTTFDAAITEAVRLTVLYRDKFARPESPPYRVRKRAGRWSDPQYGPSRWNFTRHGRESWMVFIPDTRTPAALIPDRR